ncbi:MAG: DUF2892 domain-containing protein [Methylococcales bacterium]|jgi:hypothetical protein|nr:DUF2892 domain-containing protein [Methylococcales bacterium]
MSIDQIVFAIAGFFIVTSTILAQLHNPAWLYVTVFVGLNLAQSAFTGFCPLATILKKLGAHSGPAFH